MKVFVALVLVMIMSANSLIAQTIGELERVSSVEYILKQKISTALEKQLPTLNEYADVKVYAGIASQPKINKEDTLPGVNIMGVSRVQSSSTNKGSNIDHIVVTMVLDNSATAAQDELAHIIAMKQGNLDPMRGDKIIIKHADLKKTNSVVSKLKEITKEQEKLNEDKATFKSNFKSFKRAQSESLDYFKRQVNENLATNQKKLTEKLQNFESQVTKRDKILNARMEDISKKITEPIFNMKMALKKQADTSTLAITNIYYWVALVAVALIVLLVIFLIIWRYTSKSVKDTISSQIGLAEKSIENIEKNVKEIESGKNKGESSEKIKTISNDLSTMMFGRKSDVKQFIKDNMYSEVGKEKIALLMRTVGQKSFSSLFSIGEEDIYARIVDGIRGVTIREDNADERIKDIYEEIQAHYNFTSNYENELNPFEFVNTLNKDQIMMIMEDEDYPVRALLLSQVNKELASSILESMDTKDKISVSLELAHANNVTEETYRTLGKRLARKLADMPQINNYIVNGKEYLIDLIQMLDSNEQQKMLEDIQVQDPMTYKEIYDRSLFFKDIENLSNDLLKSVVSQFDAEELAKLMSDFTEEFTSKIVTILGDRKFAMMADTLDNKSFTEEEKKDIRSRFLQTATAIVKKNNGGKVRL